RDRPRRARSRPARAAPSRARRARSSARSRTCPQAQGRARRERRQVAALAARRAVAVDHATVDRAGAQRADRRFRPAGRIDPLRRAGLALVQRRALAVRAAGVGRAGVVGVLAAIGVAGAAEAGAIALGQAARLLVAGGAIRVGGARRAQVGGDATAGPGDIPRPTGARAVRDHLVLGAGLAVIDRDQLAGAGRHDHGDVALDRHVVGQADTEVVVVEL